MNELTKENFKTEFINALNGDVAGATLQEKYEALAKVAMTDITSKMAETRKFYDDNKIRENYYFSMEFLMGRMLVNNLQNLGSYQVISAALNELGIDIHELEEIEADAGLGNGGLGRLAACFIDSVASMNLPGHGNCILYRNGFFTQKIVDGRQVEENDNWIDYGSKPYEWAKEANETIELTLFGNEKLLAHRYDMPIVGHDGKTVNTLYLWKAEVVDKNSKNAKMLADADVSLYPDDSTWDGLKLRMVQQYFFTAAGLISILNRHKEKFGTLENLDQYVSIQLNDTHPIIGIPELMRILVDEEGYEWDKAWEITTKVFSYTNHTILAEALEKWPIHGYQEIFPRITEIIEKIDAQLIDEVTASHGAAMAEKVRIIKHPENWDGDTIAVHMAHLGIYGGHAINGVAALHTEILKETELNDFYQVWPEKFQNKTNGVTHRRWLLHTNPELANLLNEKIGDSWITKPSDLIKFKEFVNDTNTIEKFLEVKETRKQMLSDLIKENRGVELPTNFMFDVQVKRLHAYKRQHLNILHIISLYQKMKSDKNFRIEPTAFIFGAKAAPAYVFAKDIIKLINDVADIVNNDTETNDYLRLVFIENYNVSKASFVFNGADVSEQISMATKEASGTGNMKFMMNGAITLGTYDGANVEIVELVGEDNAATFGLVKDEVYAVKATGYDWREEARKDVDLANVIAALEAGEFGIAGPEVVKGMDENNDMYLACKDFTAYKNRHADVRKMYQDKQKWASMMIRNIAESGHFSTDRTIDQYAKEIWGIKPTK